MINLKIQDLCCTPEQGRQLAELGVTGRSHFVAVLNSIGEIDTYCIRGEDYSGDEVYYCPETTESFSDYPVVNLYCLGELMRMVNSIEERYVFRKAFELWHLCKTTQNVHAEGFKTMEQAVANRIIIELYHKRLTPEQCNAALGV
jgi:hypothetical protein